MQTEVRGTDERNYQTIVIDSCEYLIRQSGHAGFMSKRIENIVEPVKTLKEAQGYKSLIDNTVAKACIVDRVTNKVVEWWVS